MGQDLESDAPAELEPEPEVGDGGEDAEPHEREDEPPPGGLTWIQVAVLAAACLFLGGAIAYAAVQLWPDPTPNEADIGFYDDMTTHHWQAFDLARIYFANGDDPVLRELAEETIFFQAGEIRDMQRSLEDWGETGTPDEAMQWMGMATPQDAQPGMASPEDLERLETLEGSELDDEFSRLLIDHHAGGVHMADAAVTAASLPEVRDLATIMATNQRAEVDEINHRRQKLGLPAYHPPLLGGEPN